MKSHLHGVASSGFHDEKRGGGGSAEECSHVYSAAASWFPAPAPEKNRVKIIKKRNSGHEETILVEVEVEEEGEEDCFLGIEIKIDICLKFQTFLGFAIACQKHFLGFALPFLNLCVVFFLFSLSLSLLFSWFGGFLGLNSTLSEAKPFY